LISRAKPEPDFTYSFVGDIVNNWNIAWLFATLAPTLKKFCEDLGLWDDVNSCVRARWHVEKKSIEELNALPARLPHAGKYEWIGEPCVESPKWLWDSKLGCTVRCTQKIVDEGFVAVSYACGRWRIED
jgi:hypothetical protein